MLDYAVKVTTVFSSVLTCVKSNFRVTFKFNMSFSDFLQYLLNWYKNHKNFLLVVCLLDLVSLLCLFSDSVLQTANCSFTSYGWKWFSKHCRCEILFDYNVWNWFCRVNFRYFYGINLNCQLLVILLL